MYPQLLFLRQFFTGSERLHEHRWRSEIKQLARGKGLSVYGCINSSAYIRNSPRTREFLVNMIAVEGILGTGLPAGQKCTLCLDKDVIAWRGDAILMVDKNRILLMHEV